MPINKSAQATIKNKPPIGVMKPMILKSKVVIAFVANK
jgi:hypothetical protein